MKRRDRDDEWRRELSIGPYLKWYAPVKAAAPNKRGRRFGACKLKVKVTAGRAGLDSLGSVLVGRTLPKLGIRSIRNWPQLTGTVEIRRFVRVFPKCVMRDLIKRREQCTVGRVFSIICGDRMYKLILASFCISLRLACSPVKFV